MITAAALWAGIGTLVTVDVNQPVDNNIQERRPYQVLPHALLPALARPHGRVR